MKINNKICMLSGVILYLTTVLDLFFINYTLIIGVILILLSIINLILCRNILSFNKKHFISLVICTSMAIVVEVLWLIARGYSFYIISQILFATSAISSIHLIYKIYYPNEKVNFSRKRGIIRKIFLGAIIILIIIFSILLLITAISPQLLIGYIQKNELKVSNSYEPVAETEYTILDTGHLYINDICYGIEYPNSYFDIYIADNNMDVVRPTVIFIHGGGYIRGDKLSGDPNSESNGLNEYINEMLNSGYNFVSLNYALASEYMYPVPIYQISQAVSFLINKGKEYGIEMKQVIFIGGSAGGQLEGQFVNIQTNSKYAEEMKIEPVIAKENIVAVIFHSALLDNEKFSETNNSIIDYVFFQCGRMYFGSDLLVGDSEAIQGNVIDNLTRDFPPSYISDGNYGTFDSQAKELHAKMNELGIVNYFNYYEKSEVILTHGYETGNSKWAKENQKKELEFLEEIIKR